MGAVGIKADSDKAIFPAVDVTAEIGVKDKVKLSFPAFTGALGSTEIARVHWESMAIGAAISGIIIVCGENVCGMDPHAEIKGGRVVRSPEMERRVKIFKKWYQGKGDIIVQANVEDGRLGVPEYVIEKLGVEFFELKWGQGAKNIGGEVKLHTLERAQLLRSRGYIVLPDPTDAATEERYLAKGIKEFERHSRLGMVDEDEFYKTIEHLRKVGRQARLPQDRGLPAGGPGPGGEVRLPGQDRPADRGRRRRRHRHEPLAHDERMGHPHGLHRVPAVRIPEPPEADRASSSRTAPSPAASPWKTTSSRAWPWARPSSSWCAWAAPS